MGNISNPIITRLGINQFWYKHWLSDHRFSNFRRVLGQDKCIEKLLYLYLNYGLIFRNNPFFHKFWFNSELSKQGVKTQFITLKYFRRFMYNNKSVGLEYSYTLRNNSGEYFPMKLWVLRFNNWVIISLHWFKPVKKKISPSFLGQKKRFAEAGVNSRGFALTNSLRLKLLVFVFMKYYELSNSEYVF